MLIAIALPVVMPEAAGAWLTQVVPLLVSTLPLAPGPTKFTAVVPLPSTTLFAVNVARPVPPLATSSALVKFNVAALIVLVAVMLADVINDVAARLAAETLPVAVTLTDLTSAVAVRLTAVTLLLAVTLEVFSSVT